MRPAFKTITDDFAEDRLELDDFLPYRLSVASGAVTGLISRAYRERFGLSVPQWRVMSALAEDGRLREAELIGRTMMDGLTVAQATQGLAHRGMLLRAADTVSLNLAGERLYEQIAPLAHAYEAALIAGLKPEEVKLLKRLLLRIQGAATSLAGEGEPPELGGF
ncbi:MarR family winged helix-turn-helix transcriptional regulator [Phenylobacterium immobile]|uniref:MarR family winged helix-turn-helix transcriptional regulator n=1 Tax=Phenylobacterium immobile TaxID=21 RepID=UPI000AEFE24E|nr:MarR family winged helix-turn-helix transcriptional regulator [Phenylobacterium immobile]